MNGLWSGWYDYARFGEAVPFTAWLDETAGQLLGTILEPNTFSPLELDDLESEIIGIRSGSAVTFTKTYKPRQGAHRHQILYEGDIDSAMQRVRGEWAFAGGYVETGRFELARTSQSISEGVLRKVLAPVGGGGRGSTG